MASKSAKVPVLTSGSLNIKKTPNPPRKRKVFKEGRVYKLGLLHFMARLFAINETSPKHRKMTDAEIIRQILEEYPDDKALQKRMIDKQSGRPIIRSIAKHRSEYNRGVLSPSIEPPTREQISFPYDEHGNPINVRYSPPVVMTQEQVDARRNEVMEFIKEHHRQVARAKEIESK